MTSGQPLCPEHLSQREQLGVSIADFTARADVAALPSHGTCSVASCPRQLPGHGTAYCDAHLQRLRVLRRAGQSPGDETAWRAAEPPVPRAGQVSLAGLAPSAAVEMLFGLQQRTRQGVKTYCTILRPVANDARTQQVSSLTELDIPASRGQGYASVVSTMITHARRGASDPGTEIAKDTWDMALFGHRGNLSFTAITQPWLRETAKIWALADLPRRRGRSGGDKTRHYLSSVALLSASLRQRADHGEDPAALGRTDVEVFLNRLGYLRAGGEISELTRVLACREVRNLLTTTRQLGATGPAVPPPGSATSSPCTATTCLTGPSTASPAGTCRRRSCGRSAATWRRSPHLRSARRSRSSSTPAAAPMMSSSCRWTAWPATPAGHPSWSTTTTRPTGSAGGCPSPRPPLR